MAKVFATALLARDLRANPRYELVLFDRLAEGERRDLAALAAEPGFYGVLRPRGGAELGVKSVDRDTALLFLTLGQPGPLPAYARAALGAEAARTVARLVADSVLEVADGGGFVSGAAALARLGGRPAAEAPGGGGRLAELSAAALRYAAALAVDDPGRLALRLYTYNRRPLTPRWQRLLSTDQAVRRYLGIGPGGPQRALLDAAWQPGGPLAGWLAWHARPRGEAEPLLSGGPTWKLYVSPAPEPLAEGFGAILAALTAARAAQFKVGTGPWGLLRPDKIVAYFPSFERLAAAADRLTARLAGLPAQGVPFSAEIGGGGLLSWGVDPPAIERSVPWGERESWRFWLVQRLARALLDARAAGPADPEPWRFACERLRLEGVDTATWTPGGRLWREL